MSNGPTLEQALEPLVADLPILFRIALLILLMWASLSALIAGFSCLIYGPAGATSVMRNIFARPLAYLLAQAGLLLLTLPRLLVSAVDRLLRGIARLLVGRRP